MSVAPSGDVDIAGGVDGDAVVKGGARFEEVVDRRPGSPDVAADVPVGGTVVWYGREFGHETYQVDVVRVIGGHGVDRHDGVACQRHRVHDPKGRAVCALSGQN